MNRQIKFTAILLTISLLCNMTIPAMATGSADAPSFIEESSVTEEPTAPTEETTDPTEEPADPTEEPADPTEEPADPTEEPAEPTEEPAAPTEEPAEPTEEPADPTEEPADPTEEAADLAGEIALLLDKVEGNTLPISSSRELLLLSHADPKEYCNLKLTFCPSDEANKGFDLLTKLDGLEFRGLGSAEYPFRGEILFTEQTGPIALNRPLFNVLSDDAKITDLALESHVHGEESGLLAKTVTHGQGGNTWAITLTRPEPEANVNNYLPPLVYNLEINVNTSLRINDLSGLPVLGSGYLCAEMGQNARVSLSGVRSIPTVTGSGNAVGGLVGLMRSGASLTVVGESIRISGVSGSGDVGGLVGSATDPVLSLPPAAGGDGAVVHGENVGGIVGRLTYSQGNRSLTLSLSNLTLEGSKSVGGLIGVLLCDGGTLSLNAQADGIVFADGAQNVGSFIGTQTVNSQGATLILNGEIITDTSGADAQTGSAGSAGEPETVSLEEEIQAFIDALVNAELIPGEMSPLWWAIASGKYTTEELAAELYALYSNDWEITPEIEPAEVSEPQETANLPQDNIQGEAEHSSGTASFSLKADHSSAVLDAEGSNAALSQTDATEADSASQGDGSGEAVSSLMGFLVSTYATDPTLTWPADKTQFTINSVEDLVLLSYVAPSGYAGGTITIDLTDSNAVIDLTKPYDITVGGTTHSGLSFNGLGDSGNGFSGSFVLANTTAGTYIKLNQPLFNNLSDKATIANINLYSGGSPITDATALLAGTVTHDSNINESNLHTWGIKLRGISGRNSMPVIGTMDAGSMAKVDLSLCVGTILTTGVEDTETSFTSIADYSALTVQGGGYLCDTMGTNTQLTVNLSKDSTTNLGVPKVTSSGNVGGLVGTMDSGAKLTVNAASTLPISDVESTNGNAGSLVGTMNDGAKLSINLSGESPVLKPSNVTAKEYAGGLIGGAQNPVLSLPEVDGGNGSVITSKGSDAGGLVGCLLVKCDPNGTTFTQEKEIKNLTVNGFASSGGLFGLFGNLGGTYTIEDVTSNVTFSATSTADDSKAGGLIGTYAAASLSGSLILSGNTTTSTLSSGSNVKKYGGLIGYIWGDGNSRSPAYIQISSGKVTTKEGANPSCYGGLIAELSDHGHMVQVGDPTIDNETITINNTENKFAGSTAAGGLIGKMPSGVLALDVKPTLGDNVQIEAPADKRGWVLGDRGNTLVYTTVPDWTPRTGDAAQNTNDTGVWGQVLRVDSSSPLNGLLTVDNTAHTVTVRSIDASAGAYELGNVADFAALALRLQLDSKGALLFEAGDFNSGAQIEITLSDNINLNNTGLTGLTRDVKSTDVFNLTINGNSKTITLPNLTVYTTANGHDRQGLIGKASGLTVNGLTVAGSVKYHSLGQFYAGGVLAEATGGFSLKNVTSDVDMIVDGGGSDSCAFSGFVGSTTNACTSMAFNNCTFSGRIDDNTGKNNYIGGMLAYANNNETNDNSNFTVSANNCSISNASITVSKAPSNYARVGGLFASLYYGKYTLGISGLNVSELSISVPEIQSGKISGDTINPKFCGGLLGCEWMKVDATIQNVEIEGCSLDAGNAPFGGLVYKSSGRWKVQTETVDGATKPGIHFSGSNSFTGGFPNDFPSGLLVSRGDNILNSNGTQRGALYMEIGDGAYVIEKDSVTVNVPNGRYFDEIVGITKGDNGNGIVSIATSNHELIDQSGRNTYMNQINSGWKNPHTRYYYNLDYFQDNNDGSINTPQEMVLLSAYKHADSSIRSYFSTSGNQITGDLDLTGYSYYPFPGDGGISVNNATITFDYKNLVTMETDNKSPADPNCQHYEMHTGIFTDVGSASSNANLTINGLTLRGTVGGSAIINGTARGKDSTAMTQLEISNVTLDGIRTYTVYDTLLPLLINGIESYTSLKLTDVTTGAYDNLEGGYAATSLIGDVGENNGVNQVGQYIQLDFSQIALDGRKESTKDASGNAIPVHNTTRSIFSEALFLQQFQYIDSNSWGIYNFTQTDEEHGDKYYTLGKELSNAEGAAGVRNGGEQFYFYGTEDYVYCVEANKSNSDGTPEEAAQYFVTNYLPYVKNIENSPLHQMDINLSSKDIVEGCGTYSDPYIIEYGKQLSAIAKVLSGEPPKQNWKITLNTTVLSGGLSAQDGHTSGNGTADKTFTWNGSNWVHDASNTTDNSQVIKYLRNAYYQLKTSSENKGIINLTSNWGGLGTSTNPFQGVIVGEDGVTVHIDVKSGVRFGGLIAFSTGSVVKNVKIQYDHAPSITCDAAPSSIDAPFFGGVVGWCIGGDTIIDNVSITYAGSGVPKATGTKAYLLPIGGYVGLVGGTEGFNTTSDGLGGGVVFRGTNTGSLSSVSVGGTPVTPSEDSNYFYVNPYVGRVLDGYAINEGSGFINTDKNYRIPHLASSGLSVDASGNIEISDGAGLWLLSAIVNSGAGSATANGKARFCDYGSVGQAMPNGEGADEASGALPYLIREYGLGALKTQINAGAVSIELTGDCDMRNYGNGFRGIGGSYGSISSDDRLLNVSSISSSAGSKYTVTLAQNRKEYTDESQSWTTLGTGLFPVLNPASTFTAERLILAGDTGITYYNSSDSTGNPIPGDAKLMDVSNNGTVYRLGCSGAGLLAGTMAKRTQNISSIKLTGIDLSGSVNCSATFSGGLIGLACINNNPSSAAIESFTVENCTYSNLQVNGHACVGGFLGYVYATTLSIVATSTITLSSGTFSSKEKAIKGARTGVGGLIGRCDTKELTIGGKAAGKMVFSDWLTVTNNNTTTEPDRFFTGGLAGLIGMRKDGKATVQNISITGTVAISNSKEKNSTGTLAGALTYYGENDNTDFTSLFSNTDFPWGKGGNVKAVVSNIEIALSNSDSVTIKNTKQGGVLFGFFMVKQESTIKDIQIGSDNVTKANVTIAAETASGSASLSGFIGTLSVANPLILSNICLNHINVWGRPNDGNRGTALLVGFADNNAACNIKNVKMKDCNVAVSRADAKVGFLYGEYNGNSVSGFNILIENCTVGLSLNAQKNDLAGFTAEEGNSERIGLKKGNNTYNPYSAIQSEIQDYTSAANVVLFGGKATNKNVTLVGVSVKNCNTPMKEFGDPASGTKYAIRADYTGKADGKASDVTLRPTLALPGKPLTSDGIGLTTTISDPESENPIITKTPYSQQIITEGATATNRTYFKVTDEIGKFNSGGDYQDSISTFLTVGDNTFTETFDDFPVLVINSNVGTKADDIIRAYISVLTNVSDSTLHVSDINLSCYYWTPVQGEFKQDDTRASLKKNSSGQLTITPGGYDNQRNQFTLLDVTYADPTGGTTPYHLYIPVIVKRVMQFKFWASAENGSSYYDQHYGDLEKSAIGSNKDLITSFLTFQYQWEKKDWQTAVDNGLDLLWNFDKEIIFSYNSDNNLPTSTRSTRLTLVDCNNQDLAYYGNYSSNTIKFSELTSLSTGAPWNSGDAPLCDRLKLTATEAADGTYILSDSANATLRIGDQYYRPTGDGESETQRFSIQVGLGDEELVEETYYLTLQTQYGMDDQSVYSFLIQCGPRLKNPDNKIGLPTTWIRYDSTHDYSKTGSENRVVISNFYKQEMTLTTGGSSEVMSSLNDSISGTMSTTVTFLTEEGYGAFEGQKAGRELQQQFCLSLKDQDNNPVPFPAGTTILVGDTWYSVDPGYTYWLPSQQVTDWAPNDAGKQSATVSTDFTLRFTTEGIIDTFPERAAGTEGIQVCASSSLSLNENALERSNQRDSANDTANKRFYRKEMSLATLSYNAYDIAFPDQASGLSNLGINGWDGSPASIPSAAIYDASTLKNTAAATQIKCSIDLLRKDDTGAYIKVASSTDSSGALSSYLSSIAILPKVSVGDSYQLAKSAGGFVFNLPEGGINWHSPVLIDVNTDVITGEDFEKSGHMYANYKLVLTVELLDKDGAPLEGSRAYDYIIYTNTKIRKDLIS